MIEFGYILIIIFEIFITIIIVSGLIYLENKIKNCLEALNIEASNTLNTLRNARLKLKDFNTKINDAKKFDFKKIKQILSLCFDIINFILLLKTLNFKSGLSYGFKNKFLKGLLGGFKKGLSSLLFKKFVQFLK